MKLFSIGIVSIICVHENTYTSSMLSGILGNAVYYFLLTKLGISKLPSLNLNKKSPGLRLYVHPLSIWSLSKIIS